MEGYAGKLSTIDTLRKKKITVTLVDPEGNEVSLEEAVTKITGYLTDKLGDKESVLEGTNPIITRIMPLVSQSMSVALPQFLESEKLAFTITAIDSLRWANVMVGMICFSLFQFIQKKKLKIVTQEIDLTDAEIKEMKRNSEMTSTAAAGALLGLSPQEIVGKMLADGTLSPSDLEEVSMNGDNDDDESNLN